MFSLNLLLLYQEILIRFLSNHSDFSFISESILYLILVKKTLFRFFFFLAYLLYATIYSEFCSRFLHECEGDY